MCNALVPSQVSPGEENMDRYIHIGGVAGNWDEEHHPTKVKKTFQQFRQEVSLKNYKSGLAYWLDCFGMTNSTIL